MPAALDGERVDRTVSLLTGLARAEVAELVAAGVVRLDGRSVVTRSTRVHAGDELEVDVPDRIGPVAPSGEADVELPVVYADATVVVVDKPAGLVVHPGAGNPTGTMVGGLLSRYPDLHDVGEAARPGIVHRLDKGTSGLLMVARTQPAYESLVGQLSARSVDRRYLALVLGVPEAPRGVVDAPIGRSDRDPTRMAVTATGRDARTSYEVRQNYDRPEPCSLLDAKLETGRTHQVRVHLAAIGHPVVGDHRYGGATRTIDLHRPFLHATKLSFDHPATGKRVTFDSELPPDLKQVLDMIS